MKKNSLKIVLALILSSTLFFSCAKEESAVNCTTVSASIMSDVTAYTTAVQNFEAAPNATNCKAVKSSLTAIINKVKDCPQLASMKSTYEMVLKDFTCD